MVSPVLVLDVDYRPLSVIPWQEAISSYFLGKTEVVCYSKDKTIRGVKESYPMPSVIRVVRRFKRDRIAIKFSRLNIYSRDGFRCQYCGNQKPTEELTFDHVVPRAQGGRTEWLNIVTCCIECNTDKADRTPEQAGMKLLKKPVKPKYLPTVTVRMNTRNVPEEWLPYWSVRLDK